MSRYSTFSRTALGHFKSTTMMALAACAMELGSAQAATLVRTSAFVYDANGLLQHEIVEPTNPALCVATDYLRDAWGNVSSTTVRNCAGTSYPNPNPGGTPVVEAPAPTSSTLQVSSRIILATYDVAGRFPQTVVNKGITPNQSETRYYDSRWGRQIYEQGPNGLVTTWGYDTLGRKTNELRADGTAITFFGPTQIAASGGSNYYQVTSTVSGIPQAGLGVVPVAPATLQQFDAYDRPVCSATQAFDNTVGATWYATCQAYDALGRVNQISTPLATSQPTAAPTGSTAPIGAASALPASAAAHTTTIYDPLGRVTGVMDPLNNSTTTKYEGLVTVTTDARANANSASPQNTVTKTRNAIGQVVEVEDVYGSVTSFGYEPFGNVVQTNAGGALTVAQFDLKGRRTSLSDPDTVGSATAPAWTYTYDVLGQLVQQTDAKSQVTTMAYDALGRLTSRTDLAGTTNASTSYWEYDQANSNCGASSGAVIGKLDRAWTWPGGYTRIECHDALGRTSAATTALGSTTAGGVSTSLSYTSLQQYDGASRPSTLTYPTGLTVQNNYNTNGYLASVANVATTELAGTTVFWQTSSLDPFGHVTAEVLGNGLSTRRGYYLDGRLQQISTGPGLASLPAASAIALQNETYTYDQNLNVSQRTWIAGGVEKSENFGYDLLNRLQTVSGPASKAYNYDALGNLTGKSDLGTYAYPAPTAIGPHHPASITGTINGVVNPSFVYDNNGNETSGPGTTITWTPNNMVSSVTVSGVTDMFYYGPERQRYEEVTAPKTTFYVSAQQFEVNVTTGG
ncbi:MAG: RHS repeat protein, partial [Acidobacteriota bacterium]|nr:RHS repeat protein [Acidobacteriota bacterium]